MQPYINFFGLKIASYGLLILVGFASGIIIAVIRSDIYGQKKEDIFYSSLFAVIGLIIGAKILYLLINIPYIADNFKIIIANPQYIIAMLQSGFVFYGGLFGAIVMIYIYTKKYNIDFICLVETLVPSFPLIHAFGRVGCFFAGCCYGIPFDAPIGLMFNQSTVAPHNITLFPVQLLEALLNGFIFVFLIIYAKKRRKKGNLINLYLILYSSIRFILEYFRYDAQRGFFMGLSTSQLFSVAIIILVLANLLYQKVFAYRRK